MRCEREALSSHRATTLVPVPPDAARAAVDSVRALLWPEATEVLLDRPGQLVHSVTDAGVPDVWLTWTLTPAAAGMCRVSLLLDEQADPAPPPELDDVLALVLQSCAAVHPS